MLCIILGKRKGYGKEPMAPHSMVLCMVGTGMLWVGWYGFNAGSALGADAIASNAFATTTLAAAVAGFVWGMLEWVLRGKPSVLGFCSGIVGGLVVITPAAGFVTMNSAVIMGVLAGVVPYFGVSVLKKALGYDDALDTFGVHGIGGTLGAILTGVFADEKANAIVGPLKEGLLVAQLKAVALTIVWSVVATTIIALVVKVVVGLRPTPEVEEEGLDIPEHGELVTSCTKTAFVSSTTLSLSGRGTAKCPGLFYWGGGKGSSTLHQGVARTSDVAGPDGQPPHP